MISLKLKKITRRKKGEAFEGDQPEAYFCTLRIGPLWKNKNKVLGIKYGWRIC